MCIFSVLYTNRRTQTSIGECAALSIFVKLNSRSKIYLNIREKHISTFCTLNSNHRWLRRLLWSWIMDAHSASHPSQTFTTRNSHENIAPEAQNWVNNTSLISILWFRWINCQLDIWKYLCCIKIHGSSLFSAHNSSAVNDVLSAINVWENGNTYSGNCMRNQTKRIVSK